MCTLFDAQNAGNHISELLDFKFFWGSMPPDPPRGKGPFGPFSGHNRLLHLQWLLITKVIETPGHEDVVSNSLSSQNNFAHIDGWKMFVTVVEKAFVMWSDVKQYMHGYCETRKGTNP